MKLLNKTLCLFVALVTLTSTPTFADSIDDSHMEWWREARYGMFIHWGLYSIAGGEWKGKDYGKEQGGASAEWLMNSAKIHGKEYRNALAPQFNPTVNNSMKPENGLGLSFILVCSWFSF